MAKRPDAPWSEVPKGAKGAGEPSSYQQNSIETVNELDCEINSLFEEYKNDFRDKAEQKREMKMKFFARTMFLLGFMIVAPCVCVLFAIFTGEVKIILALSAIGFAEMITALIAIPIIIAKYLFDNKEDERLNEIVIEILKHNQKRHDGINGNNT